MPSPSSSAPPPALLAQRYRLERRIAQGGMAEVWLATDESLSRQVAIKVLKSTLATDPVVAERFRREAITVARLSHPNIVAIHDSFDVDGRQAVVMQLVNGKSLRQLLDEQKRLGPELTMHIGSCVAAALDAAHAAGLVHRDVKPGNILLTPDGSVLLTDFGIAKGLGAEAEDLTSENIMMGTAKYLSPEQVRGKKLDGRADLYALGLVLYECLAGRVPFLGETDADTALARLQRDPTDLSRFRPTLPTGLADLIHELLARNPADRPKTGGELRARLARIASGIDDQTTTITPPRGTSAPATPPPPPVAPAVTTGPPLPPARAHTTPVRPERAARPAAVATRDRTPTSGSPRGVPAKEFQQRHTVTIVVSVLLLAAAVVGAVLLSRGGDGGGGGASPSTGSTQPASSVASSPPGPGGPVTIAGAVSFDPADSQGDEHPEEVANVLDGRPDTLWRTGCYNDQYFNGRPGLGLVVTLSGAGTGTLTVDVASGPYQLEAYASDAESAPTDVRGWGKQIQSKAFSDAPGAVTVSVASPARHVLVLFRQAARDASCRSEFPFRAAISEITFASA
jgi:serine/threonine-protein kinase